ncbi:hypothetical protein QJS66_01205 [Kocuria rhizophila]|nr:hypothetical protein QJS66_01205 [Kocuria rhizophila]
MPNGNASREHGVQGPCLRHHTRVSLAPPGLRPFRVCSRTASAGGRDDRGGAESAIHPMNMAAFNSMQALSRRNDEP